MNNNSPYHKEILLIYHNIQYFQQMIGLSTDPYRKMFYESLLNNEIIHLNNCQCYYQQISNLRNQENEVNLSNQIEFNLEELSQYDGSDGRPAYVAVNGIVYDVSLESTWGGGTHFSLYAGKDLTSQFNGCHGGRAEVLKNLPQVGLLKE